NENNVSSIGRDYGLPVNAAVRGQLSWSGSLFIDQPKIFLATRVERIDKLFIRGPRHSIQTIKVCVSDLRRVTSVAGGSDRDICFSFRLDRNHSLAVAGHAQVAVVVNVVGDSPGHSIGIRDVPDLRRAATQL